MSTDLVMLPVKRPFIRRSIFERMLMSKEQRHEYNLELSQQKTSKTLASVLYLKHDAAQDTPSLECA